MSIILYGARVLKDLTNQELRVLNMVETLLRKGEYAPVERIATYSGYTEKEVSFIVSKLNKKKLLRRWTGQFVGYTLTFAGFDSLALNILYNKKIVAGVGRAKGVGKESDIYYAIDFEENEIMLKINRTGRASFQQVKKRRDLLKGKFHYNVFSLAELSSKREYEVLSKLQESKLPVPKLLGRNRHIFAMDIIEGIELVKVKNLKKPLKILEKVIEYAKILYNKYNLVHADLTEYNILYDEKKDSIAIIDFPQAISTDHPDADLILERDFSHLFDYFGKKWFISPETEDVVEYVVGKK
ncbi:MAG: RIO1 family regulatory kinase/ATPase domain-containing protein [Candidatus Heimdallarchaeaceae archaeon]